MLGTKRKRTQIKVKGTWGNYSRGMPSVLSMYLPCMGHWLVRIGADEHTYVNPCRQYLVCQNGRSWLGHQTSVVYRICCQSHQNPVFLKTWLVDMNSYHSGIQLIFEWCEHPFLMLEMEVVLAISSLGLRQLCGANKTFNFWSDVICKKIL